jgi:transcriptional regulator with XRE-family HTH domain
MENLVIQRVIAIIKDKNMSPKKFAEIIGFNYSTLNNYISGRRTSIEVSLLHKISLSFDDVSLDWIITGKGSMYKNTSDGSNVDIENLKEELTMLKGENRVLREQIGLGERKDSKHRSA